MIVFFWYVGCQVPAYQTQAHADNRGRKRTENGPFQIGTKGLVSEKFTFTLASILDRGIHELCIRSQRWILTIPENS